MLKAICTRTKMIGGGNAYDVYFRVKDKPTRPLYGLTYAMEVHLAHENGFNDACYSVRDAIAPKSFWASEAGWTKYQAGQKLSKVADRLAYRIAVRAFPELKGLGRLPYLWNDTNFPHAAIEVPVKMELPS